MFNALKALAQNATLMLIVAGEDDEQLRVSVTPTYQGDKPKAHALKPLVLIGTPAELDADFAAAVGIWQAPKRSLIEQAQAAANTNDDDDDEETEDKGSTASKTRAVAKPKDDKPARAKRGAANQPPAPAANTGEAAAPTPAPAAEAIAPAPTPAPVVDTVTLNLF